MNRFLPALCPRRRVLAHRLQRSTCGLLVGRCARSAPIALPIVCPLHGLAPAGAGGKSLPGWHGGGAKPWRGLLPRLSSTPTAGCAGWQRQRAEPKLLQWPRHPAKWQASLARQGIAANQAASAGSLRRARAQPAGRWLRHTAAAAGRSAVAVDNTAVLSGGTVAPRARVCGCRDGPAAAHREPCPLLVHGAVRPPRHGGVRWPAAVGSALPIAPAGPGPAAWQTSPSCRPSRLIQPAPVGPEPGLPLPGSGCAASVGVSIKPDRGSDHLGCWLQRNLCDRAWLLSTAAMMVRSPVSQLPSGQPQAVAFATTIDEASAAPCPPPIRCFML